PGLGLRRPWPAQRRPCAPDRRSTTAVRPCTPAAGSNQPHSWPAKAATRVASWAPRFLEEEKSQRLVCGPAGQAGPGQGTLGTSSTARDGGRGDALPPEQLSALVSLILRNVLQRLEAPSETRTMPVPAASGVVRVLAGAL